MNTRTQNNSSFNPLLKSKDASRLISEIAEALDLNIHTMNRNHLMERLRYVMRAGVRAVKREEETVPFGHAAWLSIEARANRRPTTRRDLRYFIRKFENVPGWKNKPLRTITGLECRTLLQRLFHHSPHSYKKARAILHSVFAFGQKREWCGKNPVDLIDSPDIEEKTILPLNEDEIARLHAAAKMPEHRDMELSLYLLLYCGLCPSEVQRLQPEDIDWDAGVVIIRPSVSKTGGGRTVPLRRVLKLKNTIRHIPRNWKIRWRRLRHDAGFDSWVPDVCRHTFATRHAARFRNLNALQLEMGHRSIELLRSRYVCGSAPVERNEPQH